MPLSSLNSKSKSKSKDNYKARESSHTTETPLPPKPTPTPKKKCILTNYSPIQFASTVCLVILYIYIKKINHNTSTLPCNQEMHHQP